MPTENQSVRARPRSTPAIALLCVLLSMDTFALPPQLALDGRIRTSGESVVEGAVAPGAVLRTGDELRLKVTPWSDGHLYVIALGSSGTATLLHPFVDNPSGVSPSDGIPAPVRAGDSVAVPDDGGFLPLDGRPGRETILAFVAAEPVAALTRLMIRMEALLPDPAAAREVLVAAGFEPAFISFGHVHGIVASAAPSVVAPGASADAARPVMAAGGPTGAAVEEPGVLSGLGSRIAQFTRKSSAAPAQSVTAPVSATESVTARDTNPSATAPVAAPLPRASGLGTATTRPSTIERVEASPRAAAAEPPRPAQTYALPPVTRPPTSEPSHAAAAVPAPTASTQSALTAEPLPAKPTGRMIDPLPVESTLYPAPQREAISRNAAPDAAPRESETPPGLRPESSVRSTLSRLFNSQSGSQNSSQDSSQNSSGEKVPKGSEQDRTSQSTEEAVQDSGQAPTSGDSTAPTRTGPAGKQKGASASETPGQATTQSASVDPADRPDEGTPGWFTGLASWFGDQEQQPEKSAAFGTVTETESPAVASGAAPGSRDGVSSLEAHDSRASQTTSVGKKSGLSENTGDINAPGTRRPGEVLSAAGSRMPRTTAPGPATLSAAEPSGPIGADTSRESPAARKTIAARSRGAAHGAESAAASATAEIPPPPAVAPADPIASEGLVAGLQHFFGTTGEREKPAVEMSADNLQILVREQVPHSALPAQEPPDSAPSRAIEVREEQSKSESSGQGGLLAGLGVLFGSESAGSDQAAPPVADKSVAPAKAPQPRSPAAVEPSIERRVNVAGREVVSLAGLPKVQSTTRGNEDVLSASGSRIRAMLGEPDPHNSSDSQASFAAIASPGPTAGMAPAVTPGPQAPESPTVEQQPKAIATAGSRSPRTVAAALRGQNEAQAPVAGVLHDPAIAAAIDSRSVPTVSAPSREIAKPSPSLLEVALDNGSGVAASVVLVVTATGNTSGVLIDGAGHILTNWHTVHDFETAVVMFKRVGDATPARDTARPARVVAHSKFADLALLKVDAVPAGVEPVVLAGIAQAESGTPIHAIGHAAGRANDGRWQHDVFTLDRVRQSSSWYSAERVLHRADVIRGEMNPVRDISGAPLFNDQLQLVGLGAVVRVEKNEILGVSAETIRTFLGRPG